MYKRIKNHIGRHWELYLFFICIITYIIDFLWPTQFLEFTIGAIGAIYCIWHLVIFFCKPIKRDWLLAKGNFLTKVINFVLFIPIIATASISIFNSIHGNSISSKELSQKELVYEGNLYASNNVETDTLGIIVSNSTESLKKMDNEAEVDSYIILNETTLPHSIKKEQKSPSLL